MGAQAPSERSPPADNYQLSASLMVHCPSVPFASAKQVASWRPLAGPSSSHLSARALEHDHCASVASHQFGHWPKSNPLVCWFAAANERANKRKRARERAIGRTSSKRGIVFIFHHSPIGQASREPRLTSLVESSRLVGRTELGWAGLSSHNRATIKYHSPLGLSNFDGRARPDCSHQARFGVAGKQVANSSAGQAKIT